MVHPSQNYKAHLGINFSTCQHTIPKPIYSIIWLVGISRYSVHLALAAQSNIFWRDWREMHGAWPNTYESCCGEDAIAMLEGQKDIGASLLWPPLPASVARLTSSFADLPMRFLQESQQSTHLALRLCVRHCCHLILETSQPYEMNDILHSLFITISSLCLSNTMLYVAQIYMRPR
jgi:hypothetical protein